MVSATGAEPERYRTRADGCERRVRRTKRRRDLLVASVGAVRPVAATSSDAVKADCETVWNGRWRDGLSDYAAPVAGASGNPT